MAPPPFGIYTPSVTFFNEDETIDYESTTKHLERLLDSGVAGLVIHGSNGEATHLLADERVEIIKLAKRLIKDRGDKAAIIAGCSANSVFETVLLIKQAQEAGADHALVLPPNYFTPAMTKPVLTSFYVDVASKSALPIVIYNFPGVRSGIDIDSDLVIDAVSQTGDKIVGMKFTCGNLGKLQRLSSTFDASSFAPLVGKGDFLLPGLVVGSQGCISALANLVPKVHVELVKQYQAGNLAEAQKLQADLSQADWALQKGGISGVKAAVSKHFGYGTPKARSPLPTVDAATVSAGADKLQKVVDMEMKL